ncbi:MAG: glycoside hydrolase family 31 protein [Planctomycetes bacterium]|nr:glycoside hydrolase family 31 protein [Planctomycetota bacterium]
MRSNFIAISTFAILIVMSLLVSIRGENPRSAEKVANTAEAPERDSRKSPGNEVYEQKCFACHSDNYPTKTAMAEKYLAIHSQIQLSQQEMLALKDYYDSARELRYAKDDNEFIPNPGVERLQDGARPALAPRWVFEPWKWKNEHANPQEAIDDIDGMKNAGVPCGAYIIDAPWSTGLMTFEFYGPRFGQEGEEIVGKKLIEDIQNAGMKAILWMSCIINNGTDSNPDWQMESETPLWEYGSEHGFFVENPLWRLTIGRGLDGSLIKWWRGVGSHVDFNNPEAARWFYGLMDRALVDLGVDGFKVDGGWVPMTDEFYHQVSSHVMRRTLGRGVAISRPRGGNLSSSVAHWTGDEDCDWNGMHLAMRRMIAACKDGYSTVGTDTGGYGGPPTDELLIRWAQMSTFCGIMELGGGGDHEPWFRSERMTRLYKNLAVLRMQLIPYLHSYNHVAHNTGVPLMRWNDAGDFEFRCGDSFYVAPIKEEGENLARNVTLPEGRWIDYYDESNVYEGGQTITVKHEELDTFPLFVKEGAIIPMDVYVDPLNPSLSAGFENSLTLKCFPPEIGDSSFDFYWGEIEGVEASKIAMKVIATQGGKEIALTFDGRRLPYSNVVAQIHGANARDVSFDRGNGYEALDEASERDLLSRGAAPWYINSRENQVSVRVPADGLRSIRISVR